MKFKDDELDIILRSLEAYREHIQFISRASKFSNRSYVEAEDIEYEEYGLPEATDTTIPLSELIEKIRSRRDSFN